MKWTTKPTNKRVRGRSSAANVVRQRAGPVGIARDVVTPIEAWSLFISDGILEVVLIHTNRRIQEIRAG